MDENISQLLGETLVSVTGEKGQDEMTFVTESGKTFMMYHDQDCCEHVSIEDISGDLNDLVGSPITKAEQSSNQNEVPGVTNYGDESHTWTFYLLATVRGYVTIRWLGVSNGYYSESVTFQEQKKVA